MISKKCSLKNSQLLNKLKVKEKAVNSKHNKKIKRKKVNDSKMIFKLMSHK